MYWHTFAGGTCAADGKNSYLSKTNLGDYHIDPVSSPNNVNRHIGYLVRFSNIFGLLEGGLWQQIGPLVNLREAKKLCREHYEKNNKVPLLR